MNKTVSCCNNAKLIRKGVFTTLLGAATAIGLLPRAMAMQSLIVESSGKACRTEAADRQTTERLALQRARENALAQAAAHLGIAGFIPGGRVDILEHLQQECSVDCCTTSIRAEVPLPEESENLSTVADAPAIKTRGVSAKPKTPSPSTAIPVSSKTLAVQVWTDRTEYRSGDKMIINVRGNKSFYARVMYRDAGGGLVQLLPNPIRTDNYFPPGTYVIPANEDTFELEIGPPFGSEEIIVYASSTPLGHVDTKPVGGIYLVATNYADVGIRTRGTGGTRKLPSSANPGVSSNPSPLQVASVSTLGDQPSASPAVSEFCEAHMGITTHP